MISYLDSSALVKLYVLEQGSEIVNQLVANSAVVATCKVAYAEARAALARGHRDKALTAVAYTKAVTALRNDWQNYLTLEISDALVELAGDLTEKYRLRGFDAIHLAAVLLLRDQVTENIIVACWDSRLWQALKANNFALVPESLPGS